MNEFNDQFKSTDFPPEFVAKYGDALRQLSYDMGLMALENDSESIELTIKALNLLIAADEELKTLDFPYEFEKKYGETLKQMAHIIGTIQAENDLESLGLVKKAIDIILDAVQKKIQIRQNLIDQSPQ